MKRSMGFVSADSGASLGNCFWRFKQFIGFVTAAGMRIAIELLNVLRQILALAMSGNYDGELIRQSRRRRVYRRFLPLRRVQTPLNRHEM
ncbi:MAG TPA: hypothetical protein DDZ51_14425 [Planctomycetaceae bacterium]|nr:hypothetical protein [Planctomycetaceae bacterium]